MGASAIVVRVALGALIIQEKLGLTDEEVVEQIRENPYLQYFIGYGEYREEEPFDSSMMVHFRRRLGLEELSGINEPIHSKHWKQKHTKRVRNQNDDKKDKDGSGDSGGGSPNQVKLIVDTSPSAGGHSIPYGLIAVE
jgi:hypothetical protein